MSENEKKDAALAAMKVVEERVVELKEREAGWTAIVASIEKAASDAKSKIVLDVGGTRFATTKASLLRFPETYFTGLLGSGKWQPDEDGSYFIDRDPKGFDYVLDYMRSGTLATSGLKAEIVERIKAHIDYFLLPFPEAFKCSWSKDMCSPNLHIEGRKVIKTGGGPAWNAGVLGTPVNPTSFKVKAFSRGTSATIMVGLAPQTFKPSALNYSTNGFYLYLSNGNLYSQQGDSNRSYRNVAVTNGSIIEVLFNLQTKQISFVVDGTNHGVAFTVNLPDPKLQPAVEINDPNASIELC